ncbi:hypothetical protein PR048_012923 [Dryococelus australis]|uniref:Uncharacterized protein n=1 Tax=Dryococelus australis TaxID=614101 RepID=A0ABQ9HQR4_9NEOP|nr:hypothetical protein PR048_012923 [Dryococelus australis]
MRQKYWAEHKRLRMLGEFQPLRITLQVYSVQLTTNYVKGQLLQQEYTPGGREGDTLDRAFVTQNHEQNNQDVTP